MRFRFVEEHSACFPASRLCDVVGVSARGLRAFRSRPASRRQRSALVTLVSAHAVSVRSAVVLPVADCGLIW